MKTGQNPTYFGAHWELSGAASLREHPEDLLGQILWGANNIFGVACEDGRERRCRLRGKTLGQKGLEYNPLSCGDFVLLCANGNAQRSIDELGQNQDLSEAQIYCRLERRNALQRRNLKRGEPQTFAANIDGVILLLSWAGPKLRSGFLDRLWIAAQCSEAHTVVLLNKIDCIQNLRELREMHQILRRYRRLGLEIWPVCVVGPEHRAKTLRRFGTKSLQKYSPKPGRAKNLPKLPRLHEIFRALGSLILRFWFFLDSRCTHIVLHYLYLPKGYRYLNRLYVLLANKLYAVLGASGVGKSSLCNYLFCSEAQQVQAISEKWQRGVHTTTLAKIIEYREGDACYRLIDTPGLRNFLPDIHELPNLKDFYPEFSRLRNLCSYAVCEHRFEPDCAVRDALSLGLIAESRYRSYWNLYNDLQESFAKKPEYRNAKQVNASRTRAGGKVSGQGDKGRRPTQNREDVSNGLRKYPKKICLQGRRADRQDEPEWDDLF